MKGEERERARRAAVHSLGWHAVCLSIVSHTTGASLFGVVVSFAYRCRIRMSSHRIGDKPKHNKEERKTVPYKEHEQKSIHIRYSIINMDNIIFKKNNQAFSTVLLPDLNPPEIVVLPAKWIMCRSVSKYMKEGGIKKFDSRRVFYSANRQRRANFRLPVQIGSSFDPNAQANCYRGQIKGTYG